jgi:hypothetical protein
MHARVCQLAAAGTSWSSSLLRFVLLCTLALHSRTVSTGCVR